MKQSRFLRVVFFAGFLVILCPSQKLHVDNGYNAWLRYPPLKEQERAKFGSFPSVLVVRSDSPLQQTSQRELIRGVHGMLGIELRVRKELQNGSAIVLGTLGEVHSIAPDLKAPANLSADGYWLANGRINGHDCIIVAGTTDRGTLYGVFALLRKIAFAEDSILREAQEPANPVRWVNDWDNLDGRIERGYGGRSIFFENGNVRADLSRVSDYGRLLASVGINGCIVNNVNADPRVLAPDFLPQLARIAGAFRPWGVRMGISVDLSSPKSVGGLDTFDPLDPRVQSWWKEKADEIYRLIPDFAGFLVKADSEGRPGPASYGRTPADAANTVARALQPHNGIVLYRAFVYDHHLDWRNPKNDRARAAYDIFHPLDGKFDDNVIVQIKNGPIDFQVREPASPLLGGLEKTNQAIELQITLEYMGQQRHLCFLVPMWKETLDFDMRVDSRTPVKNIVSGQVFHRTLGGFAGVANVGLDANWMGNPMAMANLYGFARLAWNPNLSSATIAAEWTRLTFGNDPVVDRTIDGMLLTSWPTYENYTGPLGAGTLTDILGSHYGPGVESSERNGWGQWHRADQDGVGMDRSVATGTGYVGQYSPDVQNEFETLAATPDSLLLFFHHVPYTYRLKSGKTVIQHIYDSHYEGAESVHEFVKMWESIRNLVGDDERYEFVLARLKYQEGHAIVWRDAVCNWFLHVSGIPDDKGRVGHYPNRIEVESMQLQGYAQVDVEPAENASGGKAVACQAPASDCVASFHFSGASGTYALNVQYFDQNNGKAKFRLFAAGRQLDEWIADDTLPTSKLGGDTSTRRQISGVKLQTGDEVRIEGIPDGGELAALDYVEIERLSQ